MASTSPHPPRNTWAALLLAAGTCLFGCACFSLPGGSAFGASPGSQVDTDARYLQARLLIETGHPAAATDLLKGMAGGDDAPVAIALALADAQNADGHADEAAKTLKRALENNPASVELLLADARIQRDAGHIGEAIDELNRALKVAPHRDDVLQMLSELHLSRLIANPDTSDAEVAELIRVYNLMLEAKRGNQRLVPLLVLSTLYQKSGDTQKAVETAEEARDLSPRNQRILEALATAQIANNDIDGAIQTYARSFELAPTDEAVRHKLEALLLQKGGEEARATFFYSFAGLHSDNLAVQQACARVLMDAKRWTEAESCLETILTLKPDDVSNRLALVHVWLRMGRVQDAVAEARKLSETSGDLAPAVTLSVAESLEGDGHRAEALKLLDDYTTSHPLDENVALGLVALLIQDQQSDRALTLLEKVRAKSPGNFMAATLLAEVYAEGKQYDKAIGTLRALPDDVAKDHAIDLALLRVGLSINQGMALTDKHDFDGATRVLDAAEAELDAQPTDARSGLADRIRALRTSLLVTRGQVAQDRGDNAAAEAAYTKARDLSPDDAETWNTLGYFYAETDQKLDAARQAIDKALDLEPGAPHIIDSLGWVLYRQGNYAEAATQLEKAATGMGDVPGAAEVYSHLGDAYAKLGRDAEARRAWQKALDLKGDIDPAPLRQKLARLKS